MALRLFFLLAAMAPSFATAAASPVTPPVVDTSPASQTRGLVCTADDASVREITIDFAGARWRDAGGDWNRIVAQDDATITLVRQGGSRIAELFSDVRRVERIDRTTLVLATELHTGLIDEKRAYRCRIVAPFEAQRRI
jgi:hypothetical protein